jgi:LacI family transcriptional regulator
MSLNVTLTDIANELKTTPATISRALNGHHSISEKTKKKVRETANRLNYKPNKIASSLRKGQSGIIGVIIPSAEINFFGSVVHGIENLANKNGYNVLIYQSNEKTESEKKGIETFLSSRVDGILVSIAKNTKEYSHFLAAKSTDTPIIFFDRSNDELGIHSVVIDDYKGAFLATEHLLEQGYSRIAHISGPAHLKIFRDRLNGYRDALKKWSQPFREEFIFEGNVSIQAGKQAIAHFMNIQDPPDAVFAVEDFTALGAIKALKEKSIRIPEDFGVVGFANELFGEHISPTLSTIDQQTVKMGETSFRLILDMIVNSHAHLSEKKLVLEPLPIFRQSSMRRMKSEEYGAGN